MHVIVFPRCNIHKQNSDSLTRANTHIHTSSKLQNMNTQRSKTAFLFALWNDFVGKIEVKGKAINTLVTYLLVSAPKMD